MKLVLREYLSSLKERNELDAILPDLLSQMGFNVISRPMRGTRQDGVDVAAVGSINGGEERLYLFSIKPGNLTRREWDTFSPQSLRPSLNEIVDVYIPTKIAPEHKQKKIVVCICLGGEIEETLRANVKGVIDGLTRDNIEFEEWNGDKLAGLIEQHLMQGELIPEFQSLLRKALALLDNPEASFRYFKAICDAIFSADELAKDLKKLRQISLCLWVIFAWGRKQESLEAPFRSAEIALLYGWEIIRRHLNPIDPRIEELTSGFMSVFFAYQKISSEYIEKHLEPLGETKNGMSAAVKSSNSVDVNLKLFELIGRIAIDGLWSHWLLWLNPDEVNEDMREKTIKEKRSRNELLKRIIMNNGALFSPIKDEQIIDIDIACVLMAVAEQQAGNILGWLEQIVDNSLFSYQIHGAYPSTIDNYDDLLRHPEEKSDKYRESITNASVFYPIIAMWACYGDDNKLFNTISKSQKTFFRHSNFQIWFPDQDSEESFYLNKSLHGKTLSGITLGESKDAFFARIENEAREGLYFEGLSAVSRRFWPIIILACKVYRLPVPPQIKLSLIREYKNAAAENMDQDK
jgi:hypothetical protein